MKNFFLGILFIPVWLVFLPFLVLYILARLFFEAMSEIGKLGIELIKEITTD